MPEASDGIPAAETIRRKGENEPRGSLQRRSILDYKLKEMSNLFSRLVTSIGVS